MPPQQIIATLKGGDRRSIGRVAEVSRLILKHPRRFPELMQCLSDKDPVVRMRAADAAEKVSAKMPRLLDRHKSRLLGLLAEAEQIELRWHLAQMIPRLTLTSSEQRSAAAALHRYIDDRSSIVKTSALQALSELAENDRSLRASVRQLLEEALRSGTAAMRARARILLKNYSS